MQPSLDLDLLGLEDLPFGPTIDGHVLDAPVLDTIASGLHNDVPLAVGCNADEMTVGIPPVITVNGYEQRVHDRYGQANGDLVLAMYPPAVYGNARQALIALSTDANFVCPARRAVRAAVAGGTSDVYRYLFTHGLEGGVLQSFGAFHALELFFVFQHANAQGYAMSAAELGLSQSMLGYWTRMAIAGDPNGGGAATWPLYDPGTDPYIVLDTSIGQGAGLRAAECDLLDTL